MPQDGGAETRRGRIRHRRNTILLCASDNGPSGQYFMTWDSSGLRAPDMGSSGPFRGSLCEATEGSIRTFAFIRWPGHVKPDTNSYSM